MVKIKLRKKKNYLYLVQLPIYCLLYPNPKSVQLDVTIGVFIKGLNHFKYLPVSRPIKRPFSNQ